MAVFISIFLSLYAAVNYYIFIHGWQALDGLPLIKVIYIITFLIASLSFIAAKFMEKFLAPRLYDLLLGIGSFWFAFMLYFFLSIFLIDFFRFSCLVLHIYPPYIIHNHIYLKHETFLAVIIIVSIIIIAGYVNTRLLSVKTLKLQLRKGLGKLNGLNAVLISDVHLSPINNGSHLTNIVKKINELDPDIVFIAGDLVDDNALNLEQRNIGAALRDFKSKYGVYAITGNHEFINGIGGCVKYMNDFGLKLLRDSIVKIEDSFYVLGRDDRANPQFANGRRKTIPEILTGTDKDLPVILMDHTPFGLDEAMNNKIDLQLSGHTHHGQMFPVNMITKLIYEKSWGYLKKGSTQYYISCGVGTWGPPVKIGSPSEIVNLKIKFVE
jgi:predicted MPP superfamily phosphohydrolase